MITKDDILKLGCVIDCEVKEKEERIPTDM